MCSVTPSTLVAHEPPILSSCRRSSWINTRFSSLQHRLFWEFTVNVGKTMPRPVETLSTDLLHCAQDWRNEFQICILSAGSCSVGKRTALFLCGRSCANFVALRADFFIPRASPLRDFLGDLPLTNIVRFLSVNTADFCLAFCLPVVLLFSAYWPRCVYFAYFEMVVLETGSEIFCDIFKQTRF